MEETLTALIEKRAWAEVVAASESATPLDAPCTVLRARALIHSGRVDDALTSLSQPRVGDDEHVAYWRNVCHSAMGCHDAVPPADRAARSVGRVGSSLVKLVAAFLSGQLTLARDTIHLIEHDWPPAVARDTADPLKPHWVFFELIRAALQSLPDALPSVGDDSARLFVFGDSHIVSQAHRELRLRDGVCGRLEPMLVCSLEAWHLSHRCHPTAQRASAERQVARVAERDVVLVVCGEIDTRMGAGIDRATKSGHYADEDTAVRATAADYVDWLSANVRGRCFIQAVRPTRLIARVGRCSAVNERIGRFNAAVAERVRALANPRLAFLPVAGFAGPDGFLAAEFFVATDTFHMNAECMRAIQASILSD